MTVSPIRRDASDKPATSAAQNIERLKIELAAAAAADAGSFAAAVETLMVRVRDISHTKDVYPVGVHQSAVRIYNVLVVEHGVILATLGRSGTV